MLKALITGLAKGIRHVIGDHCSHCCNDAAGESFPSLRIANAAAIIDAAVLPHLFHRSRHAHHQDVHRFAGDSAEIL